MNFLFTTFLETKKKRQIFGAIAHRDDVTSNGNANNSIFDATKSVKNWNRCAFEGVFAQ